MRKDWLWAISRVVDAMGEIVHLVRGLANIVLRPPQKVLELLAVASCGLSGGLLDLVRRGLLANSSATQPEYS